MKLKKNFVKLLGIALVLILAIGLYAPVVQAATPAEIEESIAKGLEWLADTQNPNGSWGTWNEVARTGLAVLKFETHATFMGMSPFDSAYAYHENVEKGLDYIFNNSHYIDIFPQTAGDPDIHPAGGNGKGVYCYVVGKDSFHRMYETGIALMAICASTEPGRTVTIGSQSGRTYEEVAGDIVDYLAFGQNDPITGNYRGGWRYYENYGNSDNSISGYTTLGLSYAEAPAPWGFGLTIPAFVFSELNMWVDYIQTDVVGGTNDGGSGYTAPNNWVNILKTGNLLNQMVLLGDTKVTPRVQDAVDYIERHWNDANWDPGWKGATTPHYQACFTTMKGFQALGIEEIDVGGPLNWYDDMADAIVTTQNADGSWPSDDWGDPQLTTCWAMLTLEKAAPPALVLLPPFDTNPPGMSHTVTAEYKIAGVPQAGVQIDFEVIAGPNTGESGSGITDASGRATFTYTSNGVEGTDIIEARAIDSDTGVVLVSSQATKSWQRPPQVPAMTQWGIMAAIIILVILTPLTLRRRVLNNKVL